MIGENTMREAFEKDFPNWRAESTSNYWHANGHYLTDDGKLQENFMKFKKGWQAAITSMQTEQPLTREEIINIAEKAGAYVRGDHPQLIEGNHQVKVFEYTEKVIELVKCSNSFQRIAQEQADYISKLVLEKHYMNKTMFDKLDAILDKAIARKETGTALADVLILRNEFIDDEITPHPAPATSMQTEQPTFKREADEKAGWIIDSELVYQVSRKAGSLGAEFGVDMEQAEQVMLALETMPEFLPAPVTSMQGDIEPTDAQLITAAYQARIIDANHDWVGKLESDKLTHIRHFHNMLKAQIGWNDRVKGVSDTNKDADTIGLIASREIMDILENGDGHTSRAQLQAKIQCAVINAIFKTKGNQCELG